jgi:hypothetical protein
MSCMKKIYLFSHFMFNYNFNQTNMFLIKKNFNQNFFQTHISSPAATKKYFFLNHFSQSTATKSTTIPNAILSVQHSGKEIFLNNCKDNDSFFVHFKIFVSRQIENNNISRFFFFFSILYLNLFMLIWSQISSIIFFRFIIKYLQFQKAKEKIAFPSIWLVKAFRWNYSTSLTAKILRYIAFNQDRL